MTDGPAEIAVGLPFPLTIPFVEAMGFELLRMQAGEAEIALSLRPDQHNSLQMAHGGVTMTLLGRDHGARRSQRRCGTRRAAGHGPSWRHHRSR